LKLILILILLLLLKAAGAPERMSMSKSRSPGGETERHAPHDDHKKAAPVSRCGLGF
jgi:hypothetical protein